MNKDLELVKELHLAAKRLMENKDFKLIFDHYTNTTVLQEADKAGYAVEHRPMLFESILNRVAFKKYMEELVSVKPEELVENDLDGFEG